MKNKDNNPTVPFSDPAMQEFLNNIFVYYSQKKSEELPGESLDEGLKVFQKLDICRSLSVFLLDTATFEFRCYKTFSGISEQQAASIFLSLVEKGSVAKALESGDVFIDSNESQAGKEVPLIIPLINSSGVAGLILFHAAIDQQEIAKGLLQLFKVFAYHLAHLIKFNELQSELIATRESYGKELTYKMDNILQSKMEITKILDSLQSGVFIINKKSGKILDANTVAAKMLGISKEELIGTDRHIYCACATPTGRIPGGQCTDFDDSGCSLLSSNGSTFFIMKKITDIILGDNEEYYLESFMDATERRLAEIELQKMKDELEVRVIERTASLASANEMLTKEIDENRKLFRTVEQSPVSIIITDSRWFVEYVNPSFSKLTGYEDTNVIGKLFNLIEENIVTDRSLDEFNEMISSGGEWKREILCIKKSGEQYWSNTSVSAIRDNEGQVIHYISMQEDITQRKIMEENLHKAKEKAEASAKIKSEFLSLLSHEIRTPVNTILNFTSLLRFDLQDKLTPELSEGFASITSGSLRLIRTVDLILNAADLQTDSYEAKYEDIDLNADVIESHLGEFKYSAGLKNVNLTYSNTVEKSIVRADRHSVTQIFLNIIDNAVKFTPAGSIEVVLCNDSDGRVILKLKDTGIGISDEYIPRLFTLFSQEDTGYTRRFEGNGLGLALVKKYCELNNAVPEIITRKGEGTTVIITFSNSKGL